MWEKLIWSFKKKWKSSTRYGGLRRDYGGLQRDMGVYIRDMGVSNEIWGSPTRYWSLQRDMRISNEILGSPTRYHGRQQDIEVSNEICWIYNEKWVFQRNKVSPTRYGWSLMRYKGLPRDMGVSQRDRGNFNEIWEVFNGIGGFTTRNRGFYDIWGSPTSYEGFQREMQRCPNEKILYITPMMMISFAELVSLGSGAYARICPGAKPLSREGRGRTQPLSGLKTPENHTMSQRGSARIPPPRPLHPSIIAPWAWDLVGTFIV